jgi:hypothetical protein
MILSHSAVVVLISQTHCKPDNRLGGQEYNRGNHRQDGWTPDTFRPAVYLCNDVIDNITVERYDEWWIMKWGACERKRQWTELNVLHRAFSSGTAGKCKKTSVRAARLRAEIWIRDLRTQSSSNADSRLQRSIPCFEILQRSQVKTNVFTFEQG